MMMSVQQKEKIRKKIPAHGYNNVEHTHTHIKITLVLKNIM